MRHLFVKILRIEIIFTTEVEDFIKHKGPKITYTRQPLQNEFFIRSNDLLFEQGINQFEIRLEDWESVPCFFNAGEGSSIPFDIFAASFYLLSRYEEYLPFVKDFHGRFPPTESLAYKNDFLHLPVVDIWAFKLFDKLKLRFPDIVTKKRRFQYTSVIDVTTSHSYAFRGIFRGMAGMFLDIGTFRFKRVFQRIGVWLKIKQDPYDNFSLLMQYHKEFPCKTIFFFQFADYSTYDKNVSPENNKFRYLIKSVADYSIVSLAASYSSFSNLELLKQEKKRLSDVIHRPVKLTRMRYNRVDIPSTYRNLTEAEFTDDFSMGYTHNIGFRAGTCSPFNFYDIHMEVQQPIRVHPFAVHDYALLKYNSKKEILQELDAICSQIKQVEGELTTVFSNELLGGSHKVKWLDLYRNILAKYHVQ
ncbi:MAG: polysaccharide deacetylase family protein [Flavobacteriaceae bacterium]